MSKVAKSAIISFLVTSIFIVVAFSSSSWLETDGTLDNPKFIQLGGFFLRKLWVTDHAFFLSVEILAKIILNLTKILLV